MTVLQRLISASFAFLIDYAGRHKHPVNACLHLVGVPLVFYSIYLLFTGAALYAAFCFVLGYLCQYLGHKAQGNEVGEVILIKKVWRSFRKPEKLKGND